MSGLFTTYEISLALKDFGFNEPCVAFYKLTLGDNTPELIIGSPCNYNSGKYVTIPEDFYTDAPIWEQALSFLSKRFHVKFGFIPVGAYNTETNVRSHLHYEVVIKGDGQYPFEFRDHVVSEDIPYEYVIDKFLKSLLKEK